MTRAATVLLPLALACGQPAAVRGIVFDQNGHPVPGANVRAGDAAMVTTDALGQFVVPHFERAIYDLFVTLPEMNYGAVWRSLTRRDPAIVLFTQAPPSALHVVTVTATTSPASSFVGAFLEPSGQLNFGVNSSGPPPAVTFWSGPSPSPSRLVVLTTGSTFQRGNVPLTLSDGATLTTNVPLETAPLVTLTGTVQPAAGCQLWRGVNVVAGNKPVTLPGPISTSFSVTTGYVSELQLALKATASCAGGPSLTVLHHVSPQSETVALAIPAAPALGPIGAHGETSWTAPQNHVSVVRYFETQGAVLPVPIVDVVQTATQATFPAFPPGQTSPVTYSASVAVSLRTYGPFASLDAAALPGAILAAPERGTTDFPPQ